MKYRIERWVYQRLVARLETLDPRIARETASLWDDDTCAVKVSIAGHELESKEKLAFIYRHEPASVRLWRRQRGF